jgi:hypothetical protein
MFAEQISLSGSEADGRNTIALSIGGRHDAKGRGTADLLPSIIGGAVRNRK